MEGRKIGGMFLSLVFILLSINSADGLGGWNSSGCEVNKTDVNYTSCQCNRLTHFGVLMDLSKSVVDKVHEQILMIVAYSGCGISSVFVGITIVTHLVFHQLRQDISSKILINLCVVLLMLNLSFLTCTWSATFDNAGLCTAMAMLLHYFLMSSFTWMGLEAIHLYFVVVKVFNVHVKSYLFKCCLIGWGVPATIVGIIYIVKRDLYGILKASSSFCWMEDDLTFYISTVAYFCLIFLINLAIFFAVLYQVSFMKSQKHRVLRSIVLHDLKSAASLIFLFGLTWGLAFFAWGPVRTFFLYLFSFFNVAQGFVVFVFHCLLKKNVRKHWQDHLCCGRLQRNNKSDGPSRSGLKCEDKQHQTQENCEDLLVIQSQEVTMSCNPPLSTFRGFERRNNFFTSFQSEVCDEIASSPKYCGKRHDSTSEHGFDSCLGIY
ncbi:adhesion G-protein coupled receptor G4 [Sminthopsis crassicaudata]|uniref:adhesion G-protein coupled receptor G4 n=1 Tax=Sminthopsis crassicaudata TaxID=9301 RepID=UPI003D68099D